MNRVQSSFGNPLDFGAYMVMTIPTTLALAYFSTKHKNVWTSLTIVLIGLQLAGLWFSGGRGPYIATSMGLITLQCCFERFPQSFTIPTGIFHVFSR